MTVININNISGIASVNAQSSSLELFTNGGASLLDINANLATFPGSISVAGTVTARSGVHFGTAASGTLVVGDSDGIGIGTDNPGTKLHVEGSQNTLLHLESTDAFSGITMSDTGGSVVMQTASGYLRFLTGGDAGTFGTNSEERVRITSAGFVGIGTDNPETKLHLQDGQLTIKGSGEGGPYLYRDGGEGPDVVFHASRGTIASPTASADTDKVGNINFAGYDGSAYQRRASINGVVDGSVSSNTVPTAIIFRTGTNTTPTERLRITSSGDIQIKDDINVTFGNDGASDTKIYYSGANDFLDIGLKTGSKINIFNMSDTDNYMQFYLETDTAQIGDTFAGNTDKQYIYFGSPNGSSDPGFIMHETRGAESNEGIIHLCPTDDNQSTDYVSIHGTNDPDRIKLFTNGTISTPGSISKGSGSFSIPHPLAGLSTTNNLVHSFVEAPDASNLYAGMVDLVDGTVTVNIDTAHRMTEGTFVALNDVQSWSSSNESGYSPVKSSISGNLLTIECQDTSSTDTVYYEVRGIRKDQHMIDAHWTDENGRVITEPLQ